MNFTALILEFLKQNGTVSLPGFGTFYLKKSNAVLDSDGKSILPPGSEIAFRETAARDSQKFAQFVAKHNKVKQIDAEIEITKQVNFWNATLYKEKKLSVENLGTFFLDDSKLHFKGIRTENLSPDFYGLEEIKFSEIKRNRTKAGAFTFSNSAWWILPLLAGVLGLAYVGITQPEMIFGKKSFNNLHEEKPAPKIQKDSVKTDSANAAIAVQDSIRTDSIETVAIQPKKTAQKWSSKNYSKSKWQKSKKRRNH
ncbi:hypothetical protein MTP09_13395 [Chryseobacterium suipulveris]|uniref:CCDC81-like prokaryotic HU domain-containing protein n=1 Tax=Chryseobacterium suipulveris TaxID=2929800 RepID=A0ABY4BNY0_9FLAO|nr:hypothetical protein [Chryseobacterium suipulveris]UOE40881.1 hypothetical protein MTP09_13395 [Chryseobacterium suipulveris]